MDITGQLFWRSQRIGVIAGSDKKSEGEILDTSLRHLKTPVCAKHTQKKYLGDALAYCNGTLSFASYRYYRAFCELNHITEGGVAAREKVSLSGPPQAVARLKPSTDHQRDDRNSSPSA